MEKEKNKNLIILIILIIMAVAIVGVLVWGLSDKGSNLPFESSIDEESMLTGNKYVKESIDGLKINTSDKIKETKNLNGIQININQLSSLNNYTTILGTIKNTTEQTIEEANIILTVYDDKGNELAKKNIGKAISTLEAGQEMELNISIIEDYANAYDLKFERTNEDA